MSKQLIWVVLLLLGSLISAETSQANGPTTIYTVTFESVWSQSSHNPTSIPLPTNDHWSRLVGTTHKSGTTFWENGGIATNGIRRMAEWGWNTPLNDEVDVAIGAGNAYEWVEFPSSLGTAAGTLTANITVHSDYPHLTLVSMIAPSPDWFIGVNGLALQDSNGNWEPSITVDLYPYDAGTDAGATFEAANDENLGNPITRLQSVTPFNSSPLGTLTLTQQLPPTAVSLNSAETATEGIPVYGLATLFILIALTLYRVMTVARSKPY
ncbi:MAG: spondin domain-containing protein [Candidatus Promineifilaceae bacterium]